MGCMARVRAYVREQELGTLLRGFKMNNIDPTTAKYLIKVKINTDGFVDKPDVVGAVFGQTEGLLGEDLNLRDLQRTGRIGRIEVDITSKGGKTFGELSMSSSLDQVETAIIAAALETVDRVGPSRSTFKISAIEDVRVKKREGIVERAKEILNEMIEQGKDTSDLLAEKIKVSVQVEEVTTYGPEKLSAGPNVRTSESIIIVEGRSDVINLLRAGIKNAIAVDGTNVPESVQRLSEERVTTAFVDGDRGGELILRELFQVADIDFVARAPRGQEVEEITPKLIAKCLRNKVPADQYMEAHNLGETAKDNGKRDRRNDRNGRGDRRRDEPEERKEERRSDRPKPETRKARFNESAADKYRKSVETRELRKPAEAEPARKEEPKREEPRKEEAKTEEPAKEEPKREEPRKESRGRGSKRVLSEEQETYKAMLSEVIGTRNANLLDSSMELVRKVAVKDVVNSLKEDSEGISAIVFDGAISQRMLDQSSKSGVTLLVGARKGKVTKMPEGIEIYTKDDLL